MEFTESQEQSVRRKDEDKRLRDELVRLALEWEKRFAVPPHITDAIAEFDAAYLKGTSLRIGEGRTQNDNATTKGYDFKIGDVRYQVKARRERAKVTKAPNPKNDEWDKLIFVHYDPEYKIKEAYEFTLEAFRKNFKENERLSPKKMRRGVKLV